MSREYARRSKGGGNLPLIIAIIGTVIVIAVILYFVLSGGGFGGPKATETDTSPVTTPPQTDSPTPGPSLTAAPSPTMALVIPSESPSEVITTAPPTPTPAPSYADAKVWANSLRVHEGASLDSAVIGSVHYEDRFKVWEEANHFVKIQMTSGVFGWIHTDYVVRGDAALPAAPTSKPKPSFMKSATLESDGRIKVTFTTNVWGNSAKTSNVLGTVFTVTEGTTNRTISAITDCAGGDHVYLSFGSTSGGTLKVSIAKNGVYNSDAEGTPAGSITIGASSDNTGPSVSMSNSGSIVTVTFGEAVYGTNAGSGAIGNTSFAVAAYDKANSATIYTVTQTVVHTAGSTTATVTLDYSSVPSGATAVTTVTLKANGAFDASGNGCAQTSKVFEITR